MTPRHRLARLAAAVVTIAAAGLVLPLLGPAAPASAAVCGTGTGVTVIADFNQLGGGVQGACVSGGGGDTAQDLFRAAGFKMSYAPSQSSPFVCAISGKPSSSSCPGTDYWSLWWSTGDPGSSWVYSGQGAGDLTVPDGGLVAFSWDEVSGNERPSAAATRPAAPPTPAPTQAPTSTPTRQPTGSPSGSPSSTPPLAPTTQPPSSPGADPSDPSAPTSPTATDSETAVPSPSPSDAPTSVAPDESEPSAVTTPSEVPQVSDVVAPAAAGTADAGLPGWVAPLFIVVLFAAAGVSLLLRRRQSSR